MYTISLSLIILNTLPTFVYCIRVNFFKHMNAPFSHFKVLLCVCVCGDVGKSFFLLYSG